MQKHLIIGPNILDLVKTYSGSSAQEFWDLAKLELTRIYQRMIGEL